MPYAARAGIRLAYELAEGGDPPLVFIHGWCCDRTFFRPQLDHFGGRHALLTLDLRGCGASDRPETGYDIPALADDVAAVCQQAAVRRPVVIGHSLGGMIAVELSARYPSLPAAVVALDPGPFDPTPQARQFYAGLVAQLGGPDGEAVRRAFAEDNFLPGDGSERRTWIVETMCAVPLGAATAVIREAASWNGAGALMLCAVPLLVLLARTGGSNDPVRLLALNPAVHVGVTVGAGHFLQLEVPEQVNPMLERFLQLAG